MVAFEAAIPVCVVLVVVELVPDGVVVVSLVEVRCDAAPPTSAFVRMNAEPAAAPAAVLPGAVLVLAVLPAPAPLLRQPTAVT
jgi:hypothetical protein